MLHKGEKNLDSVGTKKSSSFFLFSGSCTSSNFGIVGISMGRHSDFGFDQCFEMF
jgi:hypothetical protein